MVNDFTLFMICMLPLLTFQAVLRIFLGICILRKKVIFSFFDDRAVIFAYCPFFMLVGMYIADYADRRISFFLSYVIALLLLNIALTVYHWLKGRDYVFYNLPKENAYNYLITLLDKNGFDYEVENNEINFHRKESKIIIEDNKRYINIRLVKCWGKKKIRMLMKEFKISVKKSKVISTSSNSNLGLNIGIIIFIVVMVLLMYIFKVL